MSGCYKAHWYNTYVFEGVEEKERGSAKNEKKAWGYAQRKGKPSVRCARCKLKRRLSFRYQSFGDRLAGASQNRWPRE